VPEADIAVLVAVRREEPRREEPCRDEEGELQFLLQKRPATGLLAGMWEFPGAEVKAGSSLTFRAAAMELASELGLAGGLENAERVRCGRSGSELEELHVVAHVFSHLKARYRPFLFQVPRQGTAPLPPRQTPASGTAPAHAGSAHSSPDPSGPRWLSVAELEDVPLPVAQGKIAELALEALKG
jgi:adenine-specific DNA glycosylase